MGGDGVIVYDLEDLLITSGEIMAASETAREIDKHNKRMASELRDCGSHDLSEATYHFLKKWSYGMEIIADDAKGLGEALLQCANAYLAADQAGVDNLPPGIVR